ncbi:unnamed protein product [Caretta caretta]
MPEPLRMGRESPSAARVWRLRPARSKMAAPSGGEAAAGPGGFEPWLAGRLDALGLDRAVYATYIQGLLREEESDEERLDALRGVLAACLEEDLLPDVCREIVVKWSEAQNVGVTEKKADEIQAIASMIEKQAQIVVKPKKVSQDEKLRKAALLAQYANVTDEEEYPFPATSPMLRMCWPPSQAAFEGESLNLPPVAFLPLWILVSDLEPLKPPSILM